MKMKKYLKAVCMALVFCFLVSYAMPVTNVQAQTRSILKYSKSAKSEKGLFEVTVALSVQDSANEIIGFQVIGVTPFATISSYEIVDQGLIMNNTRVYVHLNYYIYGAQHTDTVYIDM